jgi:hypothetical protein
MNKIPENIVGELFEQNDANEFKGPFGKEDLKKFLKDYATYYTIPVSEKGVTYRLFLEKNKRKALRVEERLIKDEWFDL